MVGGGRLSNVLTRDRHLGVPMRQCVMTRNVYGRVGTLSTVNRFFRVPCVRVSVLRISGRLLSGFRLSFLETGGVMPMGVSSVNAVVVTYTHPLSLDSHSIVTTIRDNGIRCVLIPRGRVSIFVSNRVTVGSATATLRDVGRAVSRRVVRGNLNNNSGGRLGDMRSIVGTPAMHLISSVVGRTVPFETSSVRVRPFRACIAMHCHVSNGLGRHTEFNVSTCPTVTTHLGVVTNVGVTRHHVPRSNHVGVGVGNDRCSFHVSALPAIFNRGFIVHILSGDTFGLAHTRLNFASRTGRLISGVLTGPRNVVLLSNPAKYNGSAALCAFLHRVGGPRVGVMAIRSPIRCAVPNVGRMGIGGGTGLAFTSSLHSVVHRSPSIVVVNRVHSRRATRVTIHTTVANRLIFSAVRAGSTPNILAHLSSVNVSACFISSTLVNTVSRHLMGQLYPTYGGGNGAGTTRVGTLNVSRPISVYQPHNYRFYGNANCHKHITIRRVVCLGSRVHSTLTNSVSTRRLHRLIGGGNVGAV